MLMLLATINVVDKLDKILYALMEKGIKNATILDSTNMRHALTHNDEAVSHFGILRQLLHPEREESVTLIFVGDEDQVKLIKNTILETIGNFKESDIGYFAVIPAVEGTSFKNCTLE